MIHAFSLGHAVIHTMDQSGHLVSHIGILLWADPSRETGQPWTSGDLHHSRKHTFETQIKEVHPLLAYLQLTS